MECDQEIAELVGSGDCQIASIFVNSMEEPSAARVKTQKQALAYIGEAIRAKYKAQSVDGVRFYNMPHMVEDLSLQMKRRGMSWLMSYYPMCL